MSFPPSKKKKGDKDKDTQGINSSNSTRCRILKDRRRESDLHRSPSVSLNFQPTYVKTKERARDLESRPIGQSIHPPSSSSSSEPALPGVTGESNASIAERYRVTVSCPESQREDTLNFDDS